ncbi:hypothetical protein AB0F88_00820 [Streptosporangium sp. NPDC023963]|uniref:hypothetical protein n=1 Tax=Streptosporangium sp. NPDC023963 TaxID=3155608 RepID=UPI00341238E5
MTRQLENSGAWLSYRRTASLVALTVAASLLTAPALAKPTPSETNPPSHRAADPIVGSKMEAKQQNKRAEIESLRTETSTTYANPDGKTLRTEMHARPIRLKKDGTWHPVDTSLISENGVVRPRSTTSGLVLSNGKSKQLLGPADKRATPGQKGAVFALAELPTPKITGSQAEYPSVFGRNIDLVVKSTPTGFSQQILIREHPTGPLSLQVPLQLPIGFSLQNSKTSGSLTLTRGKGTKTEKITVPPALIQDAVAVNPASDPDAGKVGRAGLSVKQAGQQAVITFAPDQAFLSDPSVTYPVTISAVDTDWWEASYVEDTFINNAEYNDSWYNFNIDRILAGKSNSGSVYWRSYIRFEDIPADSPLRGARVQNADLTLWNHLSSDC